MNELELCRDTLLPFLEEPLVAPDQLSRIVEVARDLPQVFNAFYLECRLSPPAPRVDVLAGAARPERPLPSDRLGRREELHPFVAEWLQARTAADARYVWLERDDLPGAFERAIANVHVCVDSGYRGARSSTSRELLPEFDAASARRVALDLAGAGLLSEAQSELVERCLQCLPAGGRLIHVSSMRERTPVELKLYVALPCESFAQFCRTLDVRLEDHVRALSPWAAPELNGSSVYCDVTFRGRSAHGLGLVFSQLQLNQGIDDGSRSKVRTRLVREGLSTLAQDAALAAWMKPPTDPVCVQDPARRVRRWLDLKVCSAEGLSSKAYLGFSPVVSLF